MPRPPGAFLNLMEHLFYLALGGITRSYCKRFCRMEGPWVPRPPGALLCIYFIYFIPQGAPNFRYLRNVSFRSAGVLMDTSRPVRKSFFTFKTHEGPLNLQFYLI